jgi:L-amino acid N-acyltransferase YncA
MALAFQILAPTLGYRASMFNLVFENNKASVALWDSLNFQRLGVIPNAGRLKKKDSTDEEYVNAIMFYKDFYHKSN